MKNKIEQLQKEYGINLVEESGQKKYEYEEEMTYVEGGSWSGKRFLRNLAGVLTIVSGIGYILEKCGIKIVGTAIKAAFTSYWAACAKLSGVMIKIGIKVATVSRVAAAGFLIGGAAAVWALGTVNVF